MGDPPFEYGAPRHDWNIEDIDWDPNEVRGELRASGSQDASAEASSAGAAQQVASSSGPTHESGGDVPVVLDTLQSMGSTKRRVPMQCQVDGCNKDLSVEKEYYQRYRICEEHLKLSSLLKDGVQQRFCQQCGRFHLLADFDGDKRSCRARLDLHNNRRRKRGEAGDGSFRSSARLERRLGEALHSRVSPRTRTRRVASRSRRSPLPSTDDEMTEDNSEVEQAARPRQAASSAAEAEEGTPARERRYATRQATAAAMRKHSYNPALDFEKLYPPNIAETLAALQRGAGPHEPSQAAHSRMSLQEGSSWDSSMLSAEGRQRFVAEHMLRHLSDPVQSMRDTLRQHSESGLDLRRNVLLMNSLSSPTYMPSNIERSAERSAAHGSLEQDFRESLERSSDIYQQQGAAPLPYGGPFSEALGATGLSHYAAQLLYKCASDPVAQDTFGRPNLPPAAIAGVHIAPGSAGGAAGGGGGSGEARRIISYSSEPTSISSSGLAKFPSEPFIRPRTVYPQYSAFDLPHGEFHDVAWPGPPNAPSAEEVKHEQLSFRQGPTKRFFETAEGSTQGARARSRAQQQRGEQPRRGSMDAGAASQTAGSVLPFTLPGGMAFSMGPLSSLGQSSGSGGLSRMPSAEEVAASMQREPSTERRMGRISLAHSLDIMQQRITSERQALAAGERSGSGGDVSARQRSAEGTPQQLRTSTSSRLERLPSAFLERIPEHGAALEAPLTAQDLLPAGGQAGSALLSDIYTGFNFQSAGVSAGFAAAVGSPPGARLAEGASHFAGFQGLRDASLQPWHQVASPSQGVLAPLVGTPAQTGRAGAHPEGTAWAASLFASPSSTAMSSTPSKDGTTPSSWLSPLLQQVAGGSMSAPALSSGDTAGTGPSDTAQLLSTWRADSGASFSTLPLPFTAPAPAEERPGEERTPSPAALVLAAARLAGDAALPELPAAPICALPGEMPPASAAAAQAAWAEDTSSPAAAAAAAVSAGVQAARVSAKLESAGPRDVGGRSLRPDLEDVLGGEGNVPRLEAAIRPGCVHLVVDALVLQECPTDTLDGIRKAATALAARDPLWRRGRVLLQTGSAAALLQDGVVRRIWVGQDLQRRQPEMPCAAPFAAAVPGSLVLRLHRSFFHCARSGLSCARPWRLLARYRGRFLADVDLSAMQAAHTKEVMVELGAAGGTAGLAWLEVECDGFMSAPLPVVLSPNPDIVDEIRCLEADVAAGRRSWEETSVLLADVGLILEYAALLGNKESSAVPDLRHSMCLQHVARLAQRRLIDFCELGWPALTAQALPVAALGCTSLRQLLSEVAAVPEGAGTLLHAAVRSESLSMVSLLLDLGRYGFKWDLRARCERLAQTALHLAANMDDEGRMAGLLLRHPSCPEAGMLWSVLKNAAGQTAADIAFSASKARPGRIFLLLSPEERAAIGPYHSCTERDADGSATDGDDELSPESSISASDSPPLSTQPSGTICGDALAVMMAGTLSREGSIPATPFLEVVLPSKEEEAAVAGQPVQMRTVESAPLAVGDLAAAARSCITADDRIIRKSLSADTDAHAGREQLRAALLPALAGAAAQPEGLSPPRRSLDGDRTALRFGAELGASPSMGELRRLRRAIAAFPAAAAAGAPDGSAAEMQRLSVVLRDMGAVRSASAGAVHTAADDGLPGDLPLCLSSPSTFLEGASADLAQASSVHAGREEPPLLLARASSGGQPSGAFSDALAPAPGATRRVRAGSLAALQQLSGRQVSLVLMLLASCLMLPRAAFLCMLVAAALFLLSCQPGQEVWASGSPFFRGPDANVDKLEAQASYSGWRRHLLCFKSGQMETDFLTFFAGARYQLDVLFSVLFTILSVLLLCSGAPSLSSWTAAAPWLAHASFAALPAALALNKRSWYVRNREVVMMVARIGCQLAALFCSARAAGGCSGHSHWATALFGDLLAAALQLLHLPIGFQIRTFLHLPLTLLALRLRLRVRPQPSWPQAAAVCVLMLLPTRLVAALEHRARRSFLATLQQPHVSAGVPSGRR